MAETKTNAVRIVESHHIPYTLHAYASKEAVGDVAESGRLGVIIAEKLGIPVEAVFKTLVTQGAHGGYYVFVVPAAGELDLKKAARSVGEKSVSMIPVKDINKVTGYIRGGCSPVGMKKAYVTRIDASAQGQRAIFVSAGRIGQLPDDLEIRAKVMQRLGDEPRAVGIGPSLEAGKEHALRRDSAQTVLQAHPRPAGQAARRQQRVVDSLVFSNKAQIHFSASPLRIFSVCLRPSSSENRGRQPSASSLSGRCTARVTTE